MERVIARLAQLVSEGAATRNRARQVDLSSAPESVRALADAVATHDYNIQLGEFSMYAVGDEGRSLTSLAATLETSCENGDIDLDALKATGGPGGGAFDPQQTLELGADGGGMSYFGVSWSGGKLAVVVVEFDDPTEDNILRCFATPAELFAFLDHANRRSDRRFSHLDALKAAAGIAPPAESAAPAATSGFLPVSGPLPAHPFARAFEHFAVQRMAFQAGPTPAGRFVLAQRFRAGTPPVEAQIAVVGPGGTEHALKWDVPRDVFGLCAVPGRERALLCTGTPGALVELDLQSGVEREILPRVGWSCGFVDDAHLAVLADKEVCIHPYRDGAPGEPVARMPIAGFNVFVGHGRVFFNTSQPVAGMNVAAWNGRELVHEGVFPVAANLFSLHAAVERDGQKLVCFVDTDGKAHWLAYAP